MLVADSMHLVNAVRKRFKETLFILGPFPRHLEECCKESSHKIRDVIGVDVDMIAYTNTFSSQLKRALPLPADTFYIDYRQIFGDSFGPKSLVDGVHLEDGHDKKFAHALLKGYDVLLPAPPVEGDDDTSLADALQEVGIITHDVRQDKESLKGINFDDLDYEG